MHPDWGRRYGNTWPILRRGVITMALLGAIVSAIILGVAMTHEHLDRWPVALMPLFAIPGIFIFITSPTLMFSIWIGHGRIRHVFLDRYVLTDLPAEDFERLTLQDWLYRRPAEALYRKFGFSDADFGDTGGPWAAMIQFRHGHRIRFIGAHLKILGELRDALEQARRG